MDLREKIKQVLLAYDGCQIATPVAIDAILAIPEIKEALGRGGCETFDCEARAELCHNCAHDNYATDLTRLTPHD